MTATSANHWCIAVRSASCLANCLMGAPLTSKPRSLATSSTWLAAELATTVSTAQPSSLELTEESPSSAVQIGDPITQKKMLDMVLEARDANLITCITDNGAGGLSSSIGEMAEYTNGCEIDLAKVPLKQAGLSPWEILVSESQERMTIAVKPEDQAAFEALADLHEVEATAVATFTSTGMFHVRFNEATVAYLPIEFLHEGVPQLELESEWRPPELPTFVPPEGADHNLLLHAMLQRPNIASKETWVRQYDHEVIAQTAIKPFVGVERDGPGDAGVIAPIHGDPHGLVISCGIAPRYSDIDAGAMAAASIDEAVRNAVCVGLDVDKMAGLDNFCWPDPIESTKTPDGRFKLAQLVRANRELERVCRAYRLPCVSGKDSMKNDYGTGPDKISIPPLFSFRCLATTLTCERVLRAISNSTATKSTSLVNQNKNSVHQNSRL